ncbi:MAG: hypothetical protein K1X94_35585, partial [Sandaracinaceae bacterium]|nr:hypothetical protein [Sandaracinaceae bacterium]
MTRIDPLRERVARPELAEARTLLERGGIAALVAWARERLSASLSAEARLAKLDDVEAYLRETAREPRRLRGDLGAWRKGTLD